MKEKKKKVSEQRIKARVREWVEEAVTHHKQRALGKITGVYPQLTCPVPGCYGNVRYNNGEWRCIRQGCWYVIPKHLAPPSPMDMAAYCEDMVKQLALHKTKERVSEILTTF